MSKGGRITWVDEALLGLTIVAVGCNTAKPGSEVDETETGGDGDGDGDVDTGEVPDNGIPLELELAFFDSSGKYLLLRFSEPMAPVDGVEPDDFRVSFASTWRYHYYGTIYAFAYYSDPHYYLIYNYVYGAEFVPLVVDLVGNGNQPTDIVLRFAEPLDPLTCVHFAEVQGYSEELDQLPDYQSRVGLFPHYSPGAVPIQSADGELLAAIGPDWVEYDSPIMQAEEFGWPNLDPRVEIPCNVGIDP